METGWIKLHRQIHENEFYFSEKFTKAHAWIDLLLLANYKPNTFYIRGNEIKLEKGQLGYSVLTLGKRWKWNDRTVARYLKALEKRGMIHIKNSHVTTIITILNWETYQGDTEQTTEQTTQQSMNRIHTNKKDKKEKKDKNKAFTPPSLPEVKAYFKEKGYLESTAIQAYEYYSTADWHDSKGNKVKNWKQKMIAVWFKPENKMLEVVNDSWK